MTHVKLSIGEAGLIREAVQVIPGKLYFRKSMLPLRDTPAMHFFSVDNLLVYQPFFLDFGPLNLSCIYRYCKLLKAKLEDPLLQRKVIVHCAAFAQDKIANSVFLLSSFLVVAMGRTPEDAFRPHNFGLRLRAFKGNEGSRVNINGPVLGWFDMESFDQSTYDHFEKLENGDMNWIIPGKFLAFSCPSVGATARRSGDHPDCCNPSYYVRIFKKLKIKLVVRLNKKMYDAKIFKDAGIEHHDLFFIDGTCPPKSVVEKFLQICESCDGPIAVHCKAGLGRTGSLIGCFAMKNYKFPAKAWIGWNRICRPGSVLGPQQYFLCGIQEEFMKMDAIPSCAQALRKWKSNGTGSDSGPEELVLSIKNMRLEDKQIAEHGDEGQGDRLMEAKRRSMPSTMLDGPLQKSSSMPESRSTASCTPKLRGSVSAPLPNQLAAGSRVESMLKNKYVGHLPTPITASAAAGRKPPGNTCHVSVAGSSSGMCIGSASRPSSRSRNDV